MELNQQTKKAFEVDSDEDAKIKFGNISINYQPLLDIFDPHDNPLAADERARELFLNPNVDTQSLIEKKRPEGASLFSREGFFGVSGSGYSRKDLFNLIKNDKQFAEDFEYAENQRAIQKRESDENSLRNKSYDLFTKNLGLDPKTAGSLTTVMDWTPFLGAVTGLEDAVDAYRRGDITEAAFLGALAAIDVVPYAGKLISNSIKGVVDPTVVKQMIVGEKSRLAPLVEITPSGENLKKAKDMFKEIQSNPEYIKAMKQPLGTDIKALEGVRGSNILRDIKLLPPSTQKKVSQQLEDMWVETGWIVGPKNRFFTEVDDTYVTNNSKAFNEKELSSPINNAVYADSDNIDKVELERAYNFYTQTSPYKGKIELTPEEILEKHLYLTNGQPIPMRLEEVLDHPKLYEAYPDFKNLAIRYMSDAELVDQSYGAFYQQKNSVTGVSEIVLRQGNNERFQLQALLHELQHAVQHKEGVLNYSSHFKTLTPQKKDTIEEIERLIRIEKSSPKPDNSLLRNAQFHLNKIKNLKEGMNDDFYYKLFHEAEARNVVNRTYLPMLERKMNSPYKTMTMPSGMGPNLSGNDILVKEATNPRTGKVDINVYNDNLEKVLEPINKFRDDARKVLDNYLLLSQNTNFTPSFISDKLEDKARNAYEKLIPQFEKEAIADTLINKRYPSDFSPIKKHGPMYESAAPDFEIATKFDKDYFDLYLNTDDPLRVRVNDIQKAETFWDNDAFFAKRNNVSTVPKKIGGVPEITGDAVKDAENFVNYLENFADMKTAAFKLETYTRRGTSPILRNLHLKHTAGQNAANKFEDLFDFRNVKKRSEELDKIRQIKIINNKFEKIQKKIKSDIDDDTLLPLDLKDVSEPRRPSTSTYPQIDSNLKAQLKSNQILESGQTAGFIESDFLTSPRKMESFTTIGEHVTNLGQTNRGIPSPSQSKSI